MSDDIEQCRIPLLRWKAEITLIITPEGPFFVVREHCGILGLSSVQQQLQRLRDHKTFNKYLRQWPIQTRGGVQLTWCLHRRAYGLWLGSINPWLTKPEVQDHLVDLQEDVMDALERHLFGEVPSDPLRAHLARIDSTVANLRSEIRSEIERVEQFALHLEGRIGNMENVYIPEKDDD